ARRSEKRVAPDLQRHRYYSPHLAADRSCGPHTAKIPIAERAAPPNPYPSPRFRALALFGRRPQCRVDSLSCRRPKTCTPSVWTIVGTGDFNGDGKSDILWRDTSGNVAIWLMNGAQVTQSAGVGSAPTSWSIAETGDFDGDGKSDLLWQDTS